MLEKSKKPSPDIFLLALERVNEVLGLGEEAVIPGECLVFEDSIAGVEAGRRAGMRVAWVPHQGLREVYKGREDSVLMGTTDQDSDAIRSDDSVKSEQAQGIEHEGECRRLRSRDGQAEMLATLKDFSYENYGINLKER